MMVKRLGSILLSITILLMVSCSNKQNPDKSGVKNQNATNQPAPAKTYYVVEDKPMLVNLYKESAKSSPEMLESEMACRFAATTGFNYLEVSCPTFQNKTSGLTLSLYKWDSNYYKSVANEPIAKKQFNNMVDNNFVRVTFEPQNSGEYLWVASNPIQNVGIWTCKENFDNTMIFVNGVAEQGSFKSRIHYINTPNIMLGDINMNIDYGEAPKIPVKYTFPDDSTVVRNDNFPDTYTAVDSLGRTLPTNSDVGGVREDKFVGMFYWDWHDSLGMNNIPRNITEIMKKNPEAKNNPNSQVWGPLGSSHFWNEPIWGYYRTSDKWVLRKQAEMLANAGVDVIIFDNTNGSIMWRSGYQAVFEAFEEARKDGVKTPQIAFMMNWNTNSTESVSQIKNVYFDIYRQNKYQDLWFYWGDKPLILSPSNKLNKSDNIEKEILDFFNFRTVQIVYSPKTIESNQWGWLSVYPQRLYGAKSGSCEEITVGVAQNWSKERGLTAMNGENVFGRSYTNKFGFDQDPNAKLYGKNFQEQWEYALGIDPDFIFVTGWNEWTAGKTNEWEGVPNGFPDEFNDEYSRDIEPTKGDLKDNYYYQLVSFIRKYKGVRPTPKSSGAKTIDINGSLSQWDNVKPEFKNYTNSITTRDSDGYKGTHYNNNTFRNDIILSKVAYDSENVYFYVETLNELSPKTGNAWMRLYINTNKSKGTWEGYSYVINRTNPNSKAVLEKFNGGWNFTKIADLDYSISGKVLQIKVPRSALDLMGNSIDFSFKWQDNGQIDGDILDFYSSGETAPMGRFNFYFVS